MQIRSWLSLLLLAVSLPAASQQSISLASGGTLTATATAAHTLLHLAGKRLLLKRDATIVRPAPAPTLKLIGELPGAAILLTDTYPSRPGGLAYCQAGEEQFLRVLTTSGPRPVATYTLKLASCRDTIELAQPGLSWSPTTRTLDIHWLTRAHQPLTLTLTLDPTGKPLP